MNILLDTNICVYWIKNRPASVRERLKSYRPSEVFISTITLAELHYGAAKSAYTEKNRQALSNFCLMLEIIPFDLKSTLIYGHIRAYLEKQGTPIGSLDMLIGAQALAHDFTCITNNLKEFQRIPNLKCETWV